MERINTDRLFFIYLNKLPRSQVRKHQVAKTRPPVTIQRILNDREAVSAGLKTMSVRLMKPINKASCRESLNQEKLDNFGYWCTSLVLLKNKKISNKNDDDRIQRSIFPVFPRITDNSLSAIVRASTLRLTNAISMMIMAK
jgi:hypothetical protein